MNISFSLKCVLPNSCKVIRIYLLIYIKHKGIIRAGNEPSYSGSARKKLGLGSARELNELSLNLGLINFEPEPESSPSPAEPGH